MRDKSREKVCSNAQQLGTVFLNYIAQRFHGSSLSQIQCALETAKEVHAGQTRDDGTPYILHPLRVALSIMQELNMYNAELICAALLHDTAEDNELYTPDYIEAEFGGKVGLIVRTLTKPKESIRSREEINEAYFRRLQSSGEECKLIKIADKLDNVRDAVNSPDPEKRRRTKREAEDFYIPLCESLEDVQQRKTIRGLLEKAIDILNKTNLDSQ